MADARARQRALAQFLTREPGRPPGEYPNFTPEDAERMRGAIGSLDESSLGRGGARIISG